MRVVTTAINLGFLTKRGHYVPGLGGAKWQHGFTKDRMGIVTIIGGNAVIFGIDKLIVVSLKLKYLDSLLNSTSYV